MAWLEGWKYRKEFTLSSPEGSDSYTKSLLHMGGADAAVVFPDSATGSLHVWTPSGNAQIDTAQSKFGGSSLLLDGTGDYISADDSADFAFGAANFTIDFWFRRSSDSNYNQDIYSQYVDNDNRVELRISPTAIYFWAYQAGAEKANFYTSVNQNFQLNTWYHVAVVRNGTGQFIFKDGVSQTLATSTGFGVGTMPDLAAPVQVGGRTSYFCMGWIDEFRVSKGIARWTSNFTPPTAPYGNGAVTNYQMNILIGESSGATGETIDCGAFCKTDLSDIRFTNKDGTLLDYWLESVSGVTPNQLASFWVEFDSIGVNDTTFYMYYGNYLSTSLSNGANTFIVFDDFERGANADEIGGVWTEDAGTVQISTEQKYGGTRSMKLVGAAAAPMASTGVTASDNIAIRFRLYKETNDSVNCAHGDGTNVSYLQFTNNEVIQYYNGSAFVNVGSLTPDSWELIEFSNFVWATPTVDIWRNEARLVDNADISYAASLPTIDNKVRFDAEAVPGYDVYIDNLIVRNYRNNEPIFGTWGLQQGFYGAKKGVTIPIGSGAETDAYGHFHPTIVVKDDYFYAYTMTRNASGDQYSVSLILSKDGLNWLKKGMVLVKGANPETDFQMAGYPAAIHRDGYFWLYYGSSIAAVNRINLALSKDGITFVKKGVVIPVEAGLSSSYIYPASIVQKDGYIWMYCSCYNGIATSNMLYLSKDGINFIGKGLVLPLGASGEIDDVQPLYSLRVIYKDGYFFAYYYASDGSIGRLALAISKDGFTFVKKGAVNFLGSSGEWDDAALIPSLVMCVDSVVYLYVTGGDGSNNRTGLLTSKDGINFI